MLIENPDFERNKDCPLFGIHPHGRLIDADAFKYEECGSCDGFCERCDGYECSMCRKECRCDFMKALDEATTIIEAEGERE